MNTFITFLLLLSIIFDNFDTCSLSSIISYLFPAVFSVPSVVVAPINYLIFVKTVPLPIGFMNFLWVLFKPFMAVASVYQVLATGLLAVTAVSSLILCYYINKVDPVIAHAHQQDHNQSQASNAEEVTMMTISEVVWCVKKLSVPFDEPKPAQSPEEQSTQTAHVPTSCLITPVAQSRKLSYADAVGYDHMEVKQPRHPPTIGYDVYLGDLFNEPEIQISQPVVPAPIVPARRMSYADAVGYAHMETRKPRNPPTVGYDVYLADLFHEEETNPAAVVPVAPSPIIITRRMSYADAVGYDHMEMPKSRHPHQIHSYDTFIADLFTEISDVCVSAPLATEPQSKNHQFITNILGIFDNLNITKNVNIPRYAIPKGILRSSHSHGGSVLSWSRSLIH